MTEKTRLNVDGIISLESSFIKVPFEQLKKSNRKALKYTEKELTTLTTSISDLSKLKNHSTSNDSIKALDSMLDRLKKLKRKLKDLKTEETLYAEKVDARFDHLSQLSGIKSLDHREFKIWCEKRMNRLLIDYLFRKGYLELGQHVAETYELLPFADLEFFSQANKIEVSLTNQSCSEALAWCADNKTNLKKIKSQLEFNLRLQEFIELARQRQLHLCLEYAQQYLSSYTVEGGESMHLMQPVLGCIAFGPDTLCEPYQSYYSKTRWQELKHQFRHDNFLIHSLPSISNLELTLQAGLSALKTVSCTSSSSSSTMLKSKLHLHSCPVCSDHFKELAEKLPLGHHVNSSYVCYITGEVMDEDNPPMVTPEGYVYSLKAVQEVAASHHGEFKCPRTRSIYPVKKLKRMYLT